MLKATLNELIIQLDLEVAAPLLVKARDRTEEEEKAYEQHYGKKPPAMDWVRLRAPDEGPPYIPGSSIKGVLRSHAEKIARTLAFPNFGCCNPFVEVKEALAAAEWEASCSDKFHQREQGGKHISSVQAYHDACPICKLFGCAKLASRLLIDDTYLKGNQYVIERRDGVAIDRFTGGASAGAKYDMEVMVRGTFPTCFYLRNFERWQAGLLAYVLQDLADTRLRFGYGKRRGLGKVKGVVREIKLTYFGVMPQGCTDANPIVAGIGALTHGWLERWEAYGFDDKSHVTPKTIAGVLRQSFPLPTDFTQSPWTELARCWDDFISQNNLPEKMRGEHFQQKEEVQANA